MINLPTPCHIIDLDSLDANLSRITMLKDLSGCNVHLAIKGFSCLGLFDRLKNVIDGISASGLYEAKLGHDEFGKVVHTYSPAFIDSQIEDVIKYSNGVVFNSISQFQKYNKLVKDHGRMCGIRINPVFDHAGGKDNNTCQMHSHLGIPIHQLTMELFNQIDGINVHVMCEQNADILEELVYLMDSNFKSLSDRIKWINLGGGQLVGKDNYDVDRAAKCLSYLRESLGTNVIIEPCEGIFIDCGFFATKVLDIFENEGNIAVLDSSPICHMQDALFRGWSREVIGESQAGFTYRLCGQTCFAGDSFGWYTFKDPLKVGDVIFFKDTATYTSVKNNAFNGIPFPTICTYSKNKGLDIIKQYEYNNYYCNL